MVKLVKYLTMSVLVVCTTLAGAAQAPPPPGMVAFSYGQEWRLWTDVRRLAYLQGFMEGQSDTYLAAFDDLPIQRRDSLRLQTFLFHDIGAISDVMTDLYRDPANVFIRYGAMVYLARDKLSGMEIEPALRRARQAERGYVKPPQ